MFNSGIGRGNNVLRAHTRPRSMASGDPRKRLTSVGRAGLKTLAALAWRARPRLEDMWATQSGQAPQSPPGFTPVLPEGADAVAAVPWRQVWAHLQHESLVAAPVLQLLQRHNTVDASVRAEALAALAALLGVPWEMRALTEHAWGRPFCGALPTSSLHSRAICDA